MTNPPYRMILHRAARKRLTQLPRQYQISIAKKIDTLREEPSPRTPRSLCQRKTLTG